MLPTGGRSPTCESPKVGGCLVCSWHTKEASVAEPGEGWGERSEVRLERWAEGLLGHCQTVKFV